MWKKRKDVVYCALLQVRSNAHAISGVLHAEQHADCGRSDGGTVATGRHTNLRLLYRAGGRRDNLPHHLVSPDEVCPLSAHSLSSDHAPSATRMRDFSLYTA